MLSNVRLSGVRFSFGAALIALAAFAAAGPAAAADETKRFDDWELQCRDRAPEGFPKCIITQNVTAEESKLGLLSAAIYFRPGVNTPSLGFNLAPQAIKEAGMVLQIDTKPALELPIQSCNPNICVVRADTPRSGAEHAPQRQPRHRRLQDPARPADRGSALPEGIRQCIQGTGAAQGPLIDITGGASETPSHQSMA